MAPKMVQDGSRWLPRWPQEAPRCSQDGPKRPQDAPRCSKMGPRCSQDGPRMPQDVLKMGPRGPKMLPRWAREAPRCSKMLQDGPKMRQDEPKRLPRGPKMVYQDGPKRPQESNPVLQFLQWGPARGALYIFSVVLKLLEQVAKSNNRLNVGEVKFFFSHSQMQLVAASGIGLEPTINLSHNRLSQMAAEENNTYIYTYIKYIVT